MNALHRKSDYINGVITFLRSKDGIDFQKAVTDILYEYYKAREIFFEKVSWLGGDYKNDGWVPTLSRFYQIYAPVLISDSLRADIEGKVSSDVRGLCKNVYEDGNWGGKANEIIYIVGTRSYPLPPDHERYCTQLETEINRKYYSNFSLQLTNDSYIYDILFDLDIVILEKIVGILQCYPLVDFALVNVSEIVSVFDSIAEALNANAPFFPYEEGDFDDDYSVIETEKKIERNALDEYSKKILLFLSQSIIMTNVEKQYNKSLEKKKKYTRLIQMVIVTYKKQKDFFEGIALFNKIIDEIMVTIHAGEAYRNYVTFLVTHVFIKCDIFKKV